MAVRTERPNSLPNFIGQHAVIDELTLLLEAARRRGEPPRHILLSGPPGVGKTSIGRLAAATLGTKLHAVSGPTLRTDADIADLFGDAEVEYADVILIDECHMVGKSARVAMLALLEDFTVGVRGRRGRPAREFKIDPVTVICATSEPGRLDDALRARFGARYELGYYSDSEVSEILSRYAKRQGTVLEEDAAALLAAAGRGVPRVGLDLLRDAVDLSEVSYDGRVTHPVVEEMLQRKRIDSVGLTELDRRVLLSILTDFGTSAVGAERVSMTIGVDSRTVSEVCCPYLARRGFVRLSGSGRIGTAAGYRHMGLRVPVWAVGA